MEKYRISQPSHYRISWYRTVNWNIVVDLACWMAFSGAVIAIISVILFGGFLREISG